MYLQFSSKLKSRLQKPNLINSFIYWAGIAPQDLIRKITGRRENLW